MSAIFGALSLDGMPLPHGWALQTGRDLARLGPDRQHAWEEDGSGSGDPLTATLGHCLLNTTPESLAERQPVLSLDARHAVVMAGWLHDREELAARLGVAAGLPDSALCLAAYERWAEDCPSQLEGEFSLAVLDRRERRLFLVQSRVLALPLYLARTAGLVAFATRAAPLLHLPGVGKTLNEVAFARALLQFRFQQESWSETCFRGVERLPPASCVTLGAGPSRPRRYWDPGPVPTGPVPDHETAVAGLREQLARAVRQRARSPYPVACLLSGGLDSSSIACLVARQMDGTRLVAVASALPDGGVPGAGEDERHWIEIVGRHLGIEIDYVHPPASPGPWIFPDSFFAETESPAPSPCHYLYQELYRAAGARGARLVLDGCYGELGVSHWGDAVFSRLLRQGRWGALARAIVATARREAVSPVRAVLRELAVLLAAGRRRLRPTAAPAADAAAFLHPDLLATSQLRIADWVGPVRSPLIGAPAPAGHPQSAIRNPQAADRIGYLSPWDKAARSWEPPAAFGVASQFPLRDRRLLEYCAALPVAFTHRDGLRRHLLRASMAGILPEAVRLRTSKSPFSPDYHVRMRAGCQDAVTIAAGVAAGSAAARLLDLRRLDSALATLASGTDINDATEARLQGTLCAIQFLDWFERLPAP